MKRAAERLEGHGLKLAVNQVEYSLMHRIPETNGVLETCRSLGVSLVAYRPLGRGQLATLGMTNSSLRDAVGSKDESALEAIILSIAEDHGGSVGQVALNWLLRMDELVIPIPGASKVDHAIDNAGALEWVMSKAEFNELNETA
jgi:aryl-alcohol dehydrogenase-like predicted oxidoreductase